jgi:hypothetical protein
MLPRRRATRPAAPGSLTVTCLFLFAGSGAVAWAQPPSAVRDDVVQTLLLVGDAGDPRRGGEPVLVALRRDAGIRPERTAVVFLGDNLYPAGLPPEGQPGRLELERRLDDQVDAVRDTGARVVFIPGNHDWDREGADGWNAVRRQQRRVEARGGERTVYLPKDGCPGPEVIDVGERLRIVALDTQWWLHGHARPEDPTSACAADSEPEVLAALREALHGAGSREIVVAAHHPLESGGPHGGKFGLKQHVFPLTEAKRWLWLPLPFIGSSYPIARQSGITSQDLTSAAYRRMRDAFVAVLRERPPLAWASGHEHVLQVIESPRYGRVLVSGAGIYGHATHVGDVEGSRYRAARAGYMRLDLLADGRRRLAVVEVAKDGSAREAWSAFLRQLSEPIPQSAPLAPRVAIDPPDGRPGVSHFRCDIAAQRASGQRSWTTAHTGR